MIGKTLPQFVEVKGGRNGHNSTTGRQTDFLGNLCKVGALVNFVAFSMLWTQFGCVRYGWWLSMGALIPIRLMRWSTMQLERYAHVHSICANGRAFPFGRLFLFCFVSTRFRFFTNYNFLFQSFWSFWFALFSMLNFPATAVERSLAFCFAFSF